jgi:hypothetical protein
MALQVDKFRYRDPPDLDAIRAEAVRRLGDGSGIESLVIDRDGLVVARSLPGPFTQHVLRAVLTEAGGVLVAPGGREVPADVPDWATRPLSELGWSARLGIRWRWRMSMRP